MHFDGSGNDCRFGGGRGHSSGRVDRISGEEASQD
jgi:hypothetical protein